MLPVNLVTEGSETKSSLPAEVVPCTGMEETQSAVSARSCLISSHPILAQSPL